MTKRAAENWLIKIDAHKHDDEVAHAIEDEMLWEYVADRAEEGDAIAKILLGSRDINFARWTGSQARISQLRKVAIRRCSRRPRE